MLDHAIAIWSGPRNISTAMMRAWEARGDTLVIDEPFYAFYLASTGLNHPGAAEIIETGAIDWRCVVRQLADPPPPPFDIVYQKQMAHHLLPEVRLDWLDSITHALLIRDPCEMLLSLSRITPNPTVEDTGLPQQVRLFEHFRDRFGTPPIVVDSRDILLDPSAMLSRLCDSLGVEYTEKMLCWPAGSRSTDGVWAKHWYSRVEASTGFAPYVPKSGPLPRRLSPVLAACEPLFERLHEHRLR